MKSRQPCILSHRNSGSPPFPGIADNNTELLGMFKRPLCAVPVSQGKGIPTPSGTAYLNGLLRQVLCCVHAKNCGRLVVSKRLRPISSTRRPSTPVNILSSIRPLLPIEAAMPTRENIYLPSDKLKYQEHLPGRRSYGLSDKELAFRRLVKEAQKYNGPREQPPPVPTKNPSRSTTSRSSKRFSMMPSELTSRCTCMAGYSLCAICPARTQDTRPSLYQPRYSSSHPQSVSSRR
ncbi:hypothetical protein DOTSEDRAFT_72147 [Dothistroma septosporum NZE10]|uniref:Uncharacterized protein n=1 Tax=Dothistroma septosporum (strain NZE10 / CBS 128990) TaxID=675120 RepID=N1PM77_DOTSN|nr:hypothetical protein DOTSEDRAFT_72147 [Dothistroma septosporum NZE10]